MNEAENPNPLFMPLTYLTTESNKTGSWRFLRPRYDEKTSPCSATCPAGWRILSEMSVKIARMAVQTNIFPLYEVEDGRSYTINYKPKEYLVREYFKLQGRFKHLTDQDLDQIQQMVNEDWELLLHKVGDRI